MRNTAELTREEVEERKSSFRSFYQINSDEASNITQLIIKEPKAAAILNFMFEMMDRTNGLVCSYAVFQNRFNISKATVQRAISVLKEGGFIYVYKSGSGNVYTVNPQLAWKSYGKNRKYCDFPATVILDYDEQEIKDSRRTYKSKMNRNVIALNDENGRGADTSTGEVIE